MALVGRASQQSSIQVAISYPCIGLMLSCCNMKNLNRLFQAFSVQRLPVVDVSEVICRLY